MKSLKVILCVVFSVSLHATFGQNNDSLRTTPDTVKTSTANSKVDYIAKRFNPRKALLFSAILPGAGQVYNKKYWKVPLVYGGLISLGLVVNFYNQKYVIYKNQLFSVINYPDPTGAAVVTADNFLSTSPPQLLTQKYTKAQLEDISNGNRRQRDYVLIFAGFLYILQIVDAHVDAHLKEFKVNPNLNISIEPRMEQNYYVGNTSGMALVFKF
jgi:hypothetical protein